jgi:MFS transporter, PAT family, beta-lactamase induction signal transducer AmpG
VENKGQSPKAKSGFATIATTAAILYISEGLPFGIVKEFAPMYLRFAKVDLTSIGLLNIAGFAWTFKFLWSPFVDGYGTYRRWIGAAVLAIGLSLAAMAAMPQPGMPFYTLIVILALASATQDIAVDAFTIRATPPQMLGPVNSIRVAAYRFGMMAPAPLAIVAQFLGWRYAFLTAAAIAAAVLIFTFFLPDDRGSTTVEKQNFIGALKHWLTRPRALTLLGIVLTYRLGEFAVVSMIKPYWVDRGYTPAEIGTITSAVGLGVSIASTIAAGFLVARIGLFRSLLVLGVMQCASNVGYAVVATTHAGRWSIYAAAVVENIGYGAGTAAFLAFLMSICDRERAATEYALVTATYGVTGTLMASASGAIAQHFGYPVYFWITVFLGIPALFLLPLVREDLDAASNSHS